MEGLEERLKSGGLQRTWIERQETKTRDLVGLLRTRSKRPGSSPAKKRDELAPPHMPPPAKDHARVD
jgi:hypothetical protein